MRPPHVPALVLSGLLLSVACASACAAGPAPAPSSSPPSATATSLSVATNVSPGAPGIQVTGVAPTAGTTTWDAGQVMVTYHRTSVDKQQPAIGDVVVRRCRLSVDGRRVAATADFTPLSPSAFAVVFRMDGVGVSGGAHTLRAVLPLVGGGRVTCTWAATSK